MIRGRSSRKGTLAYILPPILSLSVHYIDLEPFQGPFSGIHRYRLPGRKLGIKGFPKKGLRPLLTRSTDVD